MSGAVLGWVGLAIFVLTTVSWFKKALAVSLDGSRTIWIAGWATAALLGALGLARDPGLLGGIAAGTAFGAGAFLLVLIGISRQQVAPDAVQVGSKLPDFTAPDDDDTPFTLSGLEGRPILLKFFRGHW